MKIFIMTDMEGISGVNGRGDGIGNKTINGPTACELLTEEVNAVTEGLIQGGADKVVVCDGHGGSNSIDIRKLHPGASLSTIGGEMTPVNLLDASFDAAIQLGAHAFEGSPDGYLSHTYNSHSVANMSINGVRVGEIGITTLMASYFNIPTILVSGDTAACLEAKKFIGENNTITVETKKSLSRYSVENFNPEKVRAELKAQAMNAMKQLPTMGIRKFRPPYELEIRLMCPNLADRYEMIGAARTDHMTVVLRSDDFIDLWAQRRMWAAGVHNPRYGVSPRLDTMYS
jgi:D-amino peptidase